MRAESRREVLRWILFSKEDYAVAERVAAENTFKDGKNYYGSKNSPNVPEAHCFDSSVSLC